MKIQGVNITKKITEFRNRRISETALMKSVYQILDRENEREAQIVERIEASGGDDITNNFDLDQLDSQRIFHLEDIEQMCIHYRLRFLDSSLFKAELPYEAIFRIKNLENKHRTTLRGFRIMAPARVFKLENADDPLLFAPIGNEYYYLIHSWGRDLHPFRKLLMWPFRSLETFVLSLLVISFLLTLLVPAGLFTQKEPGTTEFFMIFFFMFKWIAGMAIFFGFKKGKNFSSAIWRSRFYNA